MKTYLISQLWHLVKMVELFGDIDALSTGITTLVGLPGYSDANNTRNNLAEEYIKTADCILLVADHKRARDDRDTRKYLTTILKQLLVDGRAVDDGFLTLVLTGADVPSGDQGVALHGDDKVAVDNYVKKAHDLEENLKRWKQAYALLERSDNSVVTKEAMEAMTRKMHGQKSELDATISSKDIVIAHARSENVSAHLQHFYQDMYRYLLRGFARFSGPSWPGERPASCVQGRERTGIPQLAQYIRLLGEHSGLTNAGLIPSEARNLVGLVHAHLKACVKTDNRLKKYEADTMAFHRAMKTDTQRMLDVAKESVDSELSEFEAKLEVAVRKAKERSGDIFQSLVALKWNVYSALMRRYGEWKEHDLNDELTKDIFRAVSPSWNVVMNKRIPAILKDSKLDRYSICKRIQRTIQDICTRSKTCTTITDQILKASLSVGYGEIMERAHTVCCRLVVAAQRDGNRFRTILQNEMKSHYDKVGAERGKGMFLRMKEENSKYILENHDSLFAAISDNAATSLEEIRSALHTQMTQALAKISLTIYTSLVSVQYATKLDSFVQKRIKKEKLPHLKALMATTEPSMRELSVAIDARLTEISQQM